MSIAMLSLIGLIIAIAISCFLPYNVGLIATSFAFILGTLVSGIKVADVLKAFPTTLFYTILGVTYLFGMAQCNGTLDRLAKWCISLVRGKAGLIPVVFWLLSFTLSAIGPGAIPVVALMAPPAMILASKMKISPLLMALMVTNGANAASMSPITYSGVIANGVIKDFALGDISMRLLWNTVLANLVISAGAYLLFGGLKLWKKREAGEDYAAATAELSEKVTYEKQHIYTLVGIAVLLFGGLVLKYDVGLLALTIGVILSILKVGDEAQAIKAMPWNAILMVTGVTILIGLMKTTGGMDMFVDLIARISTKTTAVFVVTFIPSLISVYSSTTGVCFPAFLPLVPGLAQTLGADPVAMISGITMGSLLVDASPLSTLGAIAIAATTAEMDKRKLFNQLMIWGLSMAVVGSTVAWVLFGLLGLA